jgi:eukaryotic-like serine/threonine-protein kinase
MSSQAAARSTDPLSAAADEAQPFEQRLQPGLRIGPYELIRPLGRGGMATVHLARDTRLGRRVAIKFLLEKRRQVVDDFLREARATAACQHENIVTIYAVDELDGVPYMVLEYLEGESLRASIAGRRVSATRAVELMLPVLRALTRAHELGIVHRDLKPENVLLTSSGALKVLDFGIAALFDEPRPRASEPPPTAAANTNATAETGSAAQDDDLLDTAPTGLLAGTPAYMSPEQFGAAEPDARADLWAVGIMLYEMLAGHHPVQPLTLSAVHQSATSLDQPLPSIASVDATLPARLVHAVDRSLQKRRELRWSNARELLSELEAVLPTRAMRAISEDNAPYPGLLSFQESESDRFFGREREVRSTVARLRETPLVGIIGPSGIGKSSFVRAGVVPALKSSGDAWEAFVLRPGRQPLHTLSAIVHNGSSTNNSVKDKLAEYESLILRLRKEPGYLGAFLRALAVRRNERIVIFVDQFEELYTLVSDDEERRAFLACLAGVADDAAAPLRVLISLRSDFLDRVGEDKRFADELARGLMFLQPLARDGLREALVAPLEQIGYRFESEEVSEDMVQALATTPGALPLLQFAGAKLWETRDRARKLISAASYRELGGISGVLAQHADQVVAALPTQQQKLVRALFQRLVTSDGTRAVVNIDELVELSRDPAEVRALLDQLVQARLLVLQGRIDEGGTIELIHESLIRSWPLLRRWIDEGRDDAAFREQLTIAARQWDTRGRAQGLLWRGEAMADARHWRTRHNDRLPAKEQAFLDAVFSLDTRSARMRRAALVAVIAFLSAVIAIGSVLLVQVREAEQTARRAELQSRERADVAKFQRDRARQAEARVKSQLELVEREQAAKQQAQAEVQRGKEDLRSANADLAQALQQAEAQSRRASVAASDAQKLAGSLQATNQQLERLLDAERKRAEQLERERRKILTELK